MSTDNTESAEGADSAAAEVETPETKGASFFARIPKPAKIGIAAGLALALIVGGTAAGFAGASAMQEQAAKDRYASAVAELRAAISADASATGDLAAAFTAAAESHTASAALAHALTGLVDQTKLDELNSAVAALQEATDKAAADAAVDLAAEKLLVESGSQVKVDKTSTTAFSIEKLDARTAVAEKGTSAEIESAEEQLALAANLTDAITAVDETIIALSAGLGDLAIAQVNANPSAGQAEKDATTNTATAAVKAAAEKKPSAGDVAESLTTYATAVAALKNSHTTAEAQKAAEAALKAAQEAGEATYTDPSTGEVRQNPSYNGGGDSGGSSDGGDSGGSSGGNSGGDIPPKPSISYYGTCHSGQYGTNTGGGVPTGASVVNQYWDGNSWKADWQCPTDPIGEDW
ncbi:hypothetical protein [Agromyces subbeticus]|uniref:hypothetical protein n=1 Tax=Agromyces subbeticus TaxID=293890 RepID=UPI0003B55F6F|nr:hypothetical protein [Agromyces subbeticus]